MKNWLNDNFGQWLDWQGPEGRFNIAIVLLLVVVPSVFLVKESSRDI